MLLQGAPTILWSSCSSGLRGILAEDTGLALWERAGPALPPGTVDALLALPPFLHAAAGTPAEAANLMAELVPAAGPLRADLVALGHVFAFVTGHARLRFRLEHVVDDACREFHVDRVGLRLLCTYAGPGTEWVDESGRTRRMPRFAVGLFKGTTHPDGAVRVLHRSPPVEHLPPARRSRLLLCIDQPGAFR